MRKVALDLGKRKSSYAEVVEGAVTIRATVRGVKGLLPHLGPKLPPAQVAIEACRDSWHVHDVLTSWGNQVFVVDTTRVKRLGIGQHGRKTDRIDADTLVLVLALARGDLPLSHVLSPRSRRVREELTIRSALVKTRSAYVTECRALLQARGITVRRCEAAVFPRVARELDIAPEALSLIEPLLHLLPRLQEQISDVEEALHLMADENDTVSRLATVPGVGLLVATTFVCVIDDPRRFRNAAEVSAYLGLVPSERSSGGRRRLGAITKQGNPHVRRLLVQAGWLVLRGDPESEPLVAWGQRIASRRGPRIAVVAVARRLSRILWALWKSGGVYDRERIGLPAALAHEDEAKALNTHAQAVRRSTKNLSTQRKNSARRGRVARELIQANEETMAL